MYYFVRNCPIDTSGRLTILSAFMKKITIIFLFLYLALCGQAHAVTLIDNIHITVFGTVQPGYSTSSTIDDNLSTFWHGVNDLQIGQQDVLAYLFDQPYDISQIDFFNNFLDIYLMGELDIQTSQNSTTGFDGLWTTVDHIDGDFNPPGGDFTRLLDLDSTSWVRLLMTYQGRGAHGGSPAFYLSEIDFYGEPSSVVIPEPSTLLLLTISLFGFSRRKKLA